jgi:ribonucleoside-diphosphate reductase alpha chain
LTARLIEAKHQPGAASEARHEGQAMPDNRQVARLVWAAKYQGRDPGGREERTIGDTLRRVARALASVERDQPGWEERFFRLLRHFEFLPGGRILAGAGTGGEVTLFNCFVLPIDDDSFDKALRQGVLTMRAGGGVGYDLSQCRPRRSGALGIVARLQAIDGQCAGLLTKGARRGALMATLRCDHPEIHEFITAKLKAGALPHFNLSVLVSDAFLAAVRAGRPWPLIGGDGAPMRTVPAQELWDDMLRSAYDSAEPGVLFIDRINRLNNLYYCEQISATNPCGEVPLPPFGACDLGSFNLPRFVRHAFTSDARIDEAALERAVPVAVRMLDNVIDLSNFPLEEQRETVRSTRRIGLGIMGLADALIMLGLRYDRDEGRRMAEKIMRLIRDAAYRYSAQFALEKGCFPALERQRYLASPFVASLEPPLRDMIVQNGIRNSHLLAIAPTGSISLIAGAVSSGMEPAFGACYIRSIRRRDGSRQRLEVTNHAVALWRQAGRAGLPPAFIVLADIAAKDQLKMQACLQPYVDNAISKTVALPAKTGFDEFSTLYDLAFDLGLKGCAAYRHTPVRGAVVTVSDGACGEIGSATMALKA